MHGENCNCFKIRFHACAWLKYYSVEMCREWVKYMASSLPNKEYEEQRQSKVIVNAVAEHLQFRPCDWIRPKVVPKAKAAMDAIAVLGYVPDVFREVVMCNRYGHVENHIPVRWLLTQDDLPVNPYDTRMRDAKQMQVWQRNAWGSEVAQHNRDLFARTLCALHNLASDKKLTKYRGCDLSYGMNRLQAAVKLLELKTKHHETDEQQVSAALPL